MLASVRYLLRLRPFAVRPVRPVIVKSVRVCHRSDTSAESRLRTLFGSRCLTISYQPGIRKPMFYIIVSYVERSLILLDSPM